MDLFDLPAGQYKAAVYLLSAADSRQRVRIGTQELAEALHISEATATRVMTSLINCGLIERVRRGHYVLHTPAHKSAKSAPAEGASKQNDDEASSLTDEASSLTGEVTNLSSNTSNTSNNLLTSKEVSKGAARPANIFHQRKQRDLAMTNYRDDTDDLTSIGTPAEIAKPRTLTKRQRAKRARQNAFIISRRDTWSMEDAAQLFAYRVEQARPDLFGAVAIRDLIPSLRVWAVDNNLTVQEVAQAVDAFMDSPTEVAKLERKTPPYRNFLRFLKHYQPAPVVTQSDIEESVRIAEEFFNNA